MSLTVQATDGTMLPLEDTFRTYAYSGGNLATITAAYQGKNFVQTYTYSGSNLMSRSNWVYTP